MLRTSISLVASQDGKSRSSNVGSGSETSEQVEDKNNTQLSVAVSSALLLASVVGFVQLIIYYVLAASIIRGMGLTSDSQMWHSAVSYLRIRALGTPAATLWLVTNGVFRG